MKVLDVAGLVPGAHKGLGLGNKFLDDLRSAAVLVHVVDVSGTTDEKGQATSDYDPIDDIAWLREEIELWIFGNLSRKWPTLVKKHVHLSTNLFIYQDDIILTSLSASPLTVCSLPDGYIT